MSAAKFGRVEAKRYPAADGLRGLAILLVVGHHLGLLPYLGGVDLFFVLSGFLLGGILMEKRGSDHYYKAFWARRACRMLPLYLTFLGLYFGSAALFARGLVPAPTWVGEWLFEGGFSPWYYLTFTQNFAVAGTGSYGAEGILSTWSLAAEEQFCLLLPLALVLVSGRSLPFMAAVAFVVGPLFRASIFLLDPSSLGAYVMLPGKIDVFFVGILCAWIARDPAKLAVLALRQGIVYGLLVALAASAVLLAQLYEIVPLLHVAGMDLILAGTWGLLLLSCLGGSVLSPVFGAAFLRALAPTAYGAFLFHIPVHVATCWALFTGPLAQPWYRLTGEWSGFGTGLVALPVSFVLGWLSWRFFESRFVYWGRRRFQYNGGTIRVPRKGMFHPLEDLGLEKVEDGTFEVSASFCDNWGSDNRGSGGHVIAVVGSGAKPPPMT